jgi:uncharacterized protein (TIGR03000 family)
MYSIVLMAAMTTSPETVGFGDFWAKHCFWEDCWPDRYGWIACGPGYQPYYPAPYTSCYGGQHGGFHHGGYASCHGCCGGCCGGCWGGCFGGCGGCGGCCGGCLGGAACGGCYGCYAGGPDIFSGIGYAGFGGYGNYGMYGTVPVYAAPVYATPLFESQPLDYRPTNTKPPEAEPLKIKPTEVKPKLTAAPANASLLIRVPADAKVYIDGNLMRSKSTERLFTSPEIEPGTPYFYMLRVEREKDGKTVQEVRRVTVMAGETSRLDFDNLFDRVGPQERTIVETSKPLIKP